MPLFRRHAPGSRQPDPLVGMPNTYERRLGLIGRRLDAQRCAAACVLEVVDSYIVRAITPDGELELMEFVAEDFAAGSEPPIPGTLVVSQLFPVGYEATFRVMGRHLEKRAALAIALIESGSALHLIAYTGGTAGDRMTHVPFEETFDEWALRALVDGSG